MISLLRELGPNCLFFMPSGNVAFLSRSVSKKTEWVPKLMFTCPSLYLDVYCSLFQQFFFLLTSSDVTFLSNPVSWTCVVSFFVLLESLFIYFLYSFSRNLHCFLFRLLLQPWRIIFVFSLGLCYYDARVCTTLYIYISISTEVIFFFCIPCCISLIRFTCTPFCTFHNPLIEVHV